MIVSAFLLLAAAADPATAPAKPAPEKKICRVEAVTGSFFNKRTCRTKAEWVAIESRDRESADEMMARARRRQNDGSGGGGGD